MQESEKEMKINKLKTTCFEIEMNDGNKLLVSYSTIVAAIWNGSKYKTNQFYSRATATHINSWLDRGYAASRNPAFFENLLEPKTLVEPKTPDGNVVTSEVSRETEDLIFTGGIL